MTINIAEIIDIPKCCQTITEFSKMFGISTYIYDNQGNRIIPDSHEYNCILNHRTQKDYAEDCIFFEKNNIKKVKATRSLLQSTCWCGSNTITAPIIINDEIIGFVGARGFLSSPISAEEIANIARNRNIDIDLLTTCLHRLPVIPKDKIDNLIKLLLNLAFQISNEGIKSHTLATSVTRQQKQLKIKSNKLTLALETMNFGIFEYDVTDGIFYFDENSLNIIGMQENAEGLLDPLSFEDFCKSFIPPENIEDICNIMSEMIEDNAIKHVKIQFLRSDNELRWMEVDTYCILDDLTGRKKLIGLYRDITDRNNKDIRISRQNLSIHRLTLNKEIYSGNLNDGFMEIANSIKNTLKIDNVCFWLYDSATDYLTGYEPLKNQDRSAITRQIKFSSSLSLLANEKNDANYMLSNDTSIDDNTSEYSSSIFSPYKIRAYIWAPLIVNREFKGMIACEMQDQPREWYPEEGEYISSIAHITASAFDIRERIRIQEDLAESQRLAHVSHFSWDSSKNTIQGSDEYYRIFEIDTDSTNTLKDTLKAIHPEDRAISEAIFSGKSIPDSLSYNDEFRLLMPDGRIKYVRRKLRYIMDTSYKLTRILGIIQDITKTKEFELKLVETMDQAEAANKSKSDFLANMSHEIRTPLNIIIGMIDLALDTQLSTDQYNYLSKASKASKSLLGLINDILDFSKVEAGKLSIESIPFNVKEIAENVISNVSLAMENTRFELILDIDTSIPKTIYGDPLRVNQVITNLLSNAIKFTNKGEVILKVETLSHTSEIVKLKFTVSDSGIGMTAEQQENIFKSFNQADASITRKHGGTGLGLAISKQLLNLMGGDIKVESTIGVGSAFSFELDFKIAEEEMNRSYSIPDDIKRLKVLIIDDNTKFIEIISRQISAFDMICQSATNGSNALIALDKNYEVGNYFDIILLNWDMPGVNGLETAKAILGRKYSPEPKIIMTLSHSSELALEDMKEAGVHGIIHKPILPHDLLNTIIKCVHTETDNLSHSVHKHNTTPDFSGKKILIVEDNNLNQEIALALLKKTRTTTAVAYNGLEGVGMCRSDKYDAILMDVQMPIMDGISATQAIRRFDNTTPIIAMTAHAISGDKEKSLQAGMNDYVTKPIEPKILYNVLETHLNGGAAVFSTKDNTGGKPAEWGIATEEQTKLTANTVNIESERILDSEAAIELLDNDKELYYDVLTMFINDYASSAEEIKKYFQSGRIEDAHRIAHTFKSISGNIGAPRLKEIAVDLDLKFKAGKTDLENEIDMFCNEICETIKLIEESGLLQQ